MSQVLFIQLFCGFSEHPSHSDLSTGRAGASSISMSLSAVITKLRLSSLERIQESRSKVAMTLAKSPALPADQSSKLRVICESLMLSVAPATF